MMFQPLQFKTDTRDMQSFKDARNFPSPPNSRFLNADKCPSKHKILKETDLKKSQVYKNSKQKLSEFRNTTIGFKEKTVQCLLPNNKKLDFCKKQNEDRAIKTTPHLRDKFDTRKNLRESLAKDLEKSMKCFEINMNDSENFRADPEVWKIHKPSLISITRFDQCVRETTVKPYFQMNICENPFRLLTGSVENVLIWSKVKKGFQILFEVTAILEDTQEGKWKWEKILLLSDSKTSSKLSVHYYEIDRKLPKLQGKSTVTCVGKFMSGNCLQAYKVKQSSENEKNDCQRLAFICNRTAEEMTL